MPEMDFPLGPARFLVDPRARLEAGKYMRRKTPVYYEGICPTLESAWAAARGLAKDREVIIELDENFAAAAPASSSRTPYGGGVSDSWPSWPLQPAASPTASPAKAPASPARAVAMSARSLKRADPSSPKKPKKDLAWEGLTYLNLGKGARLTIASAAGKRVTLRAPEAAGWHGGSRSALSCVGRRCSVVFENLNVEGKVFLDGAGCDWRFQNCTIDARGMQMSDPSGDGSAAVFASRPGRDRVCAGSVLRMSQCWVLGRETGTAVPRASAGVSFGCRGGMLLLSDCMIEGFDVGVDAVGPCTFEAKRCTVKKCRGPAMRLQAPMKGYIHDCNLLKNPAVFRFATLMHGSVGGGYKDVVSKVLLGVRFIDEWGRPCGPFESFEVAGTLPYPGAPDDDEDDVEKLIPAAKGELDKAYEEEQWEEEEEEGAGKPKLDVSRQAAACFDECAEIAGMLSRGV